ncbi:hypothetical protein LUW77_17310 [Streptomyces radiopugnans]|nr:hypothetical protein LUW77_17310 [Streptomyces radiopugnans]
MHRGRRHGGPQQRPRLPVRPGQAPAPPPDRPPHRRAPGRPRLPQGRHGLRAGRLRRSGRQVPARHGRQQGADAARRADARPALHPDAAGAHRRRSEISTAHLATHTMSLDRAAKGYDMFKHKKDGCVRAVFHP